MPFLGILHLRPALCPRCGTRLADAGARSFVVDPDGAPRSFGTADPPAELRVAIACPNGHELELFVPNEIAAEEAAAIPDGAPIGPDAVLLAGKTEAGAEL